VTSGKPKPIALTLTTCPVREWRVFDVDRSSPRRTNQGLAKFHDGFPIDTGRPRADRRSRPSTRILSPSPSTGRRSGIGFHRASSQRLTATIGYWLGEAYWGRGIAAEALRAVTEHAFANFDFQRLEAYVFEWNVPSTRVLEKAGYTREARLRKRVTKEGRTVDCFLYARIRE
jgi:hypothetical protein